jgi:hypothetical protein
MKPMNAAYHFIDRKVMAAFVLCGIIITLFFATASRAEAASYCVMPEVAQFSHNTTADDGAAIIKQDKTDRHVHLPTREKAKFKAFFSLLPTAQPAVAYAAGNLPLTETEAIETVSKPAYYNFLFRYKPF